MSKEKKAASQTGTTLRLLSFLKPHFWLLALALLCAIFNVAATLYAPVLIGQGIDLIIGPGNVNFEGILRVITILAVVIASGALFQWLMTLCTNHVTYHTVNRLRIQAFNKLETAPLRYIDNTLHGDIISRIINDIDQISDGLIQGFAQFFTGIITILGTIGFMVSIQPGIALVVILITPLSLFVASFIARHSFQKFREQSAARGNLTGFAEEMVGGMRVVKAFCHEEAAQQEFGEINQSLYDCGWLASFYSSLANPCTRFVNNLVYAAVCITGALSAIGGGMSVGQLTCFLTYANQYTKPFNEISGVVTELQSALACARRVFALLDEPAEPADAENALTPQKCEGHVRLEDVCFSYDASRPLIQDLNLNARPGQHIAIVGPTGCGKTTMINLLMRFYDVDGGKISVDGRDITSLTRAGLRAQYGMVLQDTWLFSGTIAENIAYGNPSASMEEIERAAKAAYAHGFIQRLPNGYDTVVSEDGGNVSQGQRQLLCIARIMLTHPPMLILDEATSSIDTRTEIKIQRAFTSMMNGRTSFVVAHRLSTIKEADCILVMRDGHIVEQGRHDTLLKQGGFYAQLYNSQFAAKSI